MGIRDLKQNPSQAVGWAKSGEEVVITERGVRVAKIVQIQTSPLQELIASGEISQPTENFSAALEGLAPVKLSDASKDSLELLRESREDKI